MLTEARNLNDVMQYVPAFCSVLYNIVCESRGVRRIEIVVNKTSGAASAYLLDM
jgi:hypothetical protein